MFWDKFRVGIIYLPARAVWGKLVFSTLTSGADRMFVAPGQRATPLKDSGAASGILHFADTSAQPKAMLSFWL